MSTRSCLSVGFSSLIALSCSLAWAQHKTPQPPPKGEGWHGRLGAAAYLGALGGSGGLSAEGGDAVSMAADLHASLRREGTQRWIFWARLQQRWGWMRRQDEALSPQKWQDRLSFGAQWRPEWSIAPAVALWANTALFDTTYYPEQSVRLNYRDKDGLEVVRFGERGDKIRLMRQGLPAHVREHVLASAKSKQWWLGLGAGGRQSFYWRGALIEAKRQGDVDLVWLDDKIEWGGAWEVRHRAMWTKTLGWSWRGRGFIAKEMLLANEEWNPLFEVEGHLFVRLGEHVWFDCHLGIEREDQQQPWVQWQQGLGIRIGSQPFDFFN